MAPMIGPAAGTGRRSRPSGGRGIACQHLLRRPRAQSVVRPLSARRVGSAAASRPPTTDSSPSRRVAVSVRRAVRAIVSLTVTAASGPPPTGRTLSAPCRRSRSRASPRRSPDPFRGAPAPTRSPAGARPPSTATSSSSSSARRRPGATGLVRVRHRLRPATVRGPRDRARPVHGAAAHVAAPALASTPADLRAPGGQRNGSRREQEAKTDTGDRGRPTVATGRDLRRAVARAADRTADGRLAVDHLVGRRYVGVHVGAVRTLGRDPASRVGSGRSRPPTRRTRAR